MSGRLEDAHHSSENESVQGQTFQGRVVKAPRLFHIKESSPPATFKLEIVEKGETYKREVRTYGEAVVNTVAGIIEGQVVTVIGRYIIDTKRRANGQNRTHKVIIADDIKVAG